MGKKKTKHVEYYELVNCSPDATPEEIKKAYRRTALRLHPDRGGNQEDFQRMKAAYDVISDPQKRKLYDQYGPDIIKMMEGQQPDSMDFILNLSTRDRLKLVATVTFISLVLLAFPILVSIRWDAVGKGEDPYSWAVAFIPLWILQVVVAIGFFSMFSVEKPDHSAHEEDRKMYDEARKELLKLRLVFMLLWSLLLLYEIFLVLKLDGTVTFSWSVVFAPLSILCGLIFVLRAVGSVPAYKSVDPRFVTINHDEEEGEEHEPSVAANKNLPSVFSLGSYWAFAFQMCKWSLAFFITSILLGVVGDWNENGDKVSFYIAFIPMLILVIGSICFRALLWVISGTKGGEDGAATQGDGKLPNITFCQFLVSSIPFALLLTLICLCASKLTANVVSAFILFLPVFIVVGCCCCISSLVICTVSPEDLAKEEERQQQQQHGGEANEGQDDETHGNDGNNSVYGTVNFVEATIQEEQVQLNVT